MTFVPPETAQLVYVEPACTTFALTIVAAALSVNATLSMFGGLLRLRELEAACEPSLGGIRCLPTHSIEVNPSR